MTGKVWLWTIATLVATFIAIGALAYTAQALITVIPALAPPDSFPPWLKPGATFSMALFAGFIGVR